MNLGKLLGAGKSFVSGSKSAAYRADKRFYLPQFVSPKNPFASSSKTPTQAELTEPTTEKSAAPVKQVASLLVKTQKIPELAAQGAKGRATTWVSRLNPVTIFCGAPSPAGKGVVPVQVELSLEKVKVVHNDLTDADVEIVPMKSRPAREPVPAGLPPSKKSWTDLGERILKATAL